MSYIAFGTGQIHHVSTPYTERGQGSLAVQARGIGAGGTLSGPPYTALVPVAAIITIFIHKKAVALLARGRG